MKQFKIFYKWSELNGYQTNYAFVKADSAEQAKAKFIESWQSDAALEILTINQVGAL